MGIIHKRVNLKPVEYPECQKYKEGIQHSYWTENHFTFISDTVQFYMMPSHWQMAAKRASLAISQIEVNVKKFWLRIGERFPKPEIDQVGIVFAESEVRHSDSYSKLIEKLGINGDFEKIVEEPVIKGRIEYLTKYLENAASFDNKKYIVSLALFSLFIENTSLFSQFLILKSFNQYERILKDVDNLIQATAREENLHGEFGAWLINTLKRENPEWFDDEFEANMYHAARKALDAENKIIDWIFSEGELEFLPKSVVKEFIKDRFNCSLQLIGLKPQFEVSNRESFEWFYEEKDLRIDTDFFHKKPVTYGHDVNSFNVEDLF